MNPRIFLRFWRHQVLIYFHVIHLAWLQFRGRYFIFRNKPWWLVVDLATEVIDEKDGEEWQNIIQEAESELNLRRRLRRRSKNQ